MSDLILSNANVPAAFNFKDEKLNALSLQISGKLSEMNALISDARERAESINRALAPLFGELLTSKCYEKDGFKSVAEYADKTFGIGRSMSYLLGRVGRDFYNDDNEYTSVARETLTVSKLDAMGQVDRVALANAIEAGEITADTSLEDCRTFGATHPKNPKKSKVKVVPTFDIYAMKCDGGALLISNIIKEDFLPRFASALHFSEEQCGIVPIVLDGDKTSFKKHAILYTPDGHCRMFEYQPHTTPKQPKRGKKSGELFDFKAYLASLDPKERADFLREALGESAE